jgi:hypothetical protein
MMLPNDVWRAANTHILRDFLCRPPRTKLTDFFNIILTNKPSILTVSLYCYYRPKETEI